MAENRGLQVRAALYRQKAADMCKRAAETTADDPSRLTLMAVAQSYETLAKSVEEIAAIKKTPGGGL